MVKYKPEKYKLDEKIEKIVRGITVSNYFKEKFHEADKGFYVYVHKDRLVKAINERMPYWKNKRFKFNWKFDWVGTRNFEQSKERDRYFKSILFFTFAIETYPNDCEGFISTSDTSKYFFNRGMCYQCVKDYESAINDFTKAYEIHNYYRYPIKFRAYAYFDLKDYDKALEDINFALETMDYDTELYYNRALVHANLNNFDEAFKDLNIVLERKPDDKVALQTIEDINNHILKSKIYSQ
ncbi:tetratricopeptide repeat protein [Nanoarchaeota archaeon]